MDTLQHQHLREAPVYFEAGDETLFGILTTPRTGASKTAVIVLTGRGFPSPNRNRLSVHLCRTLAGLGFSCLRFDYHGVGESTGFVDDFDLSKPFVNDLDGAISLLRGLGFERFVLIGSCFGARTALALAPKVQGLEAIVLLAVPLHEDAGSELALRLSSRESVRRALRIRTLRKIFQAKDRRRYISVLRSKLALSTSKVRTPSNAAGPSAALIDSFTRSLEEILVRKISVLFIYGNGDRYYRQFKKATQMGLRELLDRAGPLVSLTELEGKVHGFTSVEIQAQVIDAVRAWFQSHPLRATDSPDRVIDLRTS